MKKIVYILESLACTGGVERIVTEKANYLAEHYGYDVSLIVCTQRPDQPNAFQLSKTVKQYYLSIPLYSQYRYKYPKRLWKKYKINKNLNTSISEQIHQIKPDIIIGIAHFRANNICDINYNAKIIIECHEARLYTHSGMSQHKSTYRKLYKNFFRIKYFKTIEKKADVVVTLTEGDKRLWSKAKRTVVIPNFSNMPIHKMSTCDTKRIIAVGRLSWEKGYDRLLKIWKNIDKKYPNWQLDIFGEGELESYLRDIVTKDNLNNVGIHKFTNNISDEYSKSSIFVMTSYYEGFPLVILEALKHGVPCIAFNCPFGPASLIEDNECGFLIEDNNYEQFYEKLSLLMIDEHLRKLFSDTAIKRSEAFTIDLIMEQWKTLFESL